MIRAVAKFTLAAAIAGVSGCTLFFWLPGWYAIAGLTLVAMLAPAAIVSGIVFARGSGQAFCIGCAATGGALPMAYVYFSLSMLNLSDAVGQIDEQTTQAFKIAFAVLLVITLGSGLVAMGVRKLAVWGRSERLIPGQPPLHEIIAGPDLPEDVEYAVIQTRVKRHAV